MYNTKNQLLLNSIGYRCAHYCINTSRILCTHLLCIIVPTYYGTAFEHEVYTGVRMGIYIPGQSAHSDGVQSN